MRGCSCSSHTYIRLWCTAVQPWPVCIAAQSVGERVLCSPWLPVEAAASFSAGLADSAACSAAAGSVAAAARLIRCHGLARSGSWHEARISRIAGSMVSTDRSGPLHRHSERHPSAGSASSARRILIHAATHYLTVSSCKAHGKCHASRWANHTHPRDARRASCRVCISLSSSSSRHSSAASHVLRGEARQRCGLARWSCAGSGYSRTFL